MGTAPFPQAGQHEDGPFSNSPLSYGLSSSGVGLRSSGDGLPSGGDGLRGVPAGSPRASAQLVHHKARLLLLAQESQTEAGVA